jgi:hypothetical protein
VIINYFSGAKSNNTAGNIAKQRCYVSKQIKKHKIPMANSKPKNKMEKMYEVEFSMSANINKRGTLCRKNRIQLDYGQVTIIKKRSIQNLLPTKVVISSFEASETGLPEGWIKLHGKCSVISNKGELNFSSLQFYDYSSRPSIKGFYKNFKGVFGPDKKKDLEALKVEIQGDIRLFIIRKIEDIEYPILSDDLFEIPD